LKKFEKNEFCSANINIPTFNRITSQFSQNLNNLFGDSKKEEILMFFVSFFMNQAKRFQNLKDQINKSRTKKLCKNAETRSLKQIWPIDFI
jgi:hypothetical protein